MKKHLVVALALVFVLSLSSAAFAAANPFVDVPAKHWAYDAVSQLAKAGIVDGYNDGTFRGDKTMTRYEMAQIVAKAMAKEDKADAATKATIDKLAVEFAAELNNLGVRVTKLEQNQSTIKFSGDARIRYTADDKQYNNPAWAERVRIVGTANVNDNTSLYLRWEALNHNTFGTITSKQTNVMSDANLTTKGLLKNTDLTVGRYSLNLGQTTYLAGSTGMFDGAYFTYKSGKAALVGGYADSNPVNDSNFAVTSSVFTNAGNIAYGEFNYKFDNKVKANVTYVKNQDNNGKYTVPTTASAAGSFAYSGQELVDIFGAGLTWTVAPNLVLSGDYWKNSADGVKVLNGGDDPTAYVAKLYYKGANAKAPHTWGAGFEYLKAEAGSIDGNWTGAMVKVAGDGALNGQYVGLKAWDFQFNYTLAKNVVLDAFYQFNMKDPQTGNNWYKNGGDNYTRVQVNYMF